MEWYWGIFCFAFSLIFIILLGRFLFAGGDPGSEWGVLGVLSKFPDGVSERCFRGGVVGGTLCIFERFSFSLLL